MKDYKRKRFAYNQNGQQASMPIIAPKGFLKEESSDTSGIQLHHFIYPNGAQLYAVYLIDTSFEIQPFNKAIHQPKLFYTKGQVYKGEDSLNHFYREIRQGHLRFGYSGVDDTQEVYFDSATNFAAMHHQ